ncbi:MAG: hypothetical protein AB1324_04315 [Candidatus Micrarchaeota archaeon]
MSTGICVRCGASGIVEYGPDGLAYCSNCAFYGLNRQCWRCRMYLPAIELQQYQGQWTCPYCIQDLRSEASRAESAREKKPHLDVIAYPETCERCGRDLEGRTYIWNGKRLCRSCLGDEQEKWGIVGGGPMGSPQKIIIGTPERKKRTSLIESLISEFLHVTGIRKKPRKMEVVVYPEKMPIRHAKPMTEGAIKRTEKIPQTEGLIKEKAVPARKPESAGGQGQAKAPEPAKKAEAAKKDATPARTTPQTPEEQAGMAADTALGIAMALDREATEEGKRKARGKKRRKNKKSA